MRFLISIFLYFFIVSSSTAQIKDDDIKTKNKYIRYLFVPDSNTRCALLNFNYSYLYMPDNISFSTNGTHISLGFNVARFFTKKMILGVCFDLKFFSGLKKQNFKTEFTTDFNSNFNYNYSNENDSLHGFALKSIINENDKTYAYSNRFQNIGIEFSPFPNKYGGIVLQIKSGFREYRTAASGYNLSDTDNRNTYLLMRKCLSFNLLFNPYLFFTTKRNNFINPKPKDFFKYILVSLYCEKLNLDDATYGGVAIQKLVNQNFIDKYSSKYNFGVKLGFGLY